MRPTRSPSRPTSRNARPRSSRWEPDMRRMLKPLACFLAAMAMAPPVAACGDRDPDPQVVAPAPPISARGNPARELDAMRRHVPVDEEITPLPMARVENFDMTRERAYPMQPPTIPHSIDGY